MNSRRDFLKNTAILGAGLAIGFSLEKGGKLFHVDASRSYELTPFILINQEGMITLVNPNPDMGQGSTQAIPALIAEELEVDMNLVRVIQSDGQAKYGVQISGGSGSVRRAWEPLRKAGAAAREMLVKAASAKWGCITDECVAENGMILHKKSGKRFRYADLVAEASTYEIPQNPSLKAKKDFRIIGKMTRRPDVVDRVTGKAVYGIDVEVPGMVYAAILHSPNLFSKVLHIDSSAARKVKGVIDVIKCERPMPHRKAEAVAVIAENFWSACKGRKALNVSWDKPSMDLDTNKERMRMKEASVGQGLVHSEHGVFERAFVQSPSALTAYYETPFLAHAPLEPECATVHVKNDGTVEVWAPVQGPDWARTDIAKYLGIIPERIKIHVTLLGGSFGRKAYHDFLLEACFLSNVLKVPVKVIWLREDDISQGPFRAGMASQMSGIYSGQKVTGFHHHALGESIDAQIHNNLTAGIPDPVLCGEIDFKNSTYQFYSGKISYTRVPTDIPIVWWRSVYASNFAWSQECFIDELAHAARIDPLEARLALLEDGRHRLALTKLAEVSDYKRRRKSTSSAIGLAIWKSFGTICATAVIVSMAEHGVVVNRVISVIDCGIYVNPDMVKAQTEGNIIMGLGAATKKGISLSGGRSQQTNFDRYEILRMRETPEIEIHIMENDETPGGVGEPGLPPVAPALGNAVFNLTGKRHRSLPLDLAST